MAPTHYADMLTRLADGAPHGDTDVVYHSRGAVLIVCDDPFNPAPLHTIDLPGPTMLVSERPELLAAIPDSMGLVTVQGRITRLHGWLGQFRAEFSDGPEQMPRHPGTDGTFDLVIDLSTPPLIDTSVPPFGYFAPRDPQQLTAALEQAGELIGHFGKPKYFHYEPGLCAHTSFGQPGCTRCLEVCAADAIRSAGEHIAVNPQLCQGCAACTLACPSGALSYADPTRETLLSWLEQALEPLNDVAPTLLARHPGTRKPACDPYPVIDLPVAPLAAFGEELWLAALAHGAAQVVLLVDAEIPHETRRLLEARVALARSVLDACGQTADAISLVEGDEQALELIRRVSLRPPSAIDPGPLPAHHKRALFTHALARLEEPGGFEPGALAVGSHLGTIIVDQQQCTLCSACARICPPAAIRYADDAQSGLARLAFAEELCVQCSACEHGCPEQAIRLEPRVAPLATRGYWRVLNEEPLAACLDCGRRFMPNKLLEANIRRMEESGTPMAAVEQTKRCPDCRHRRIRGG